MECAQLARLLINGSIANRAELLCSYPQFTSAQVAEELQQQCYEAWTHEPTAIGRIAETARSLRRHIEGSDRFRLFGMDKCY